MTSKTRLFPACDGRIYTHGVVPEADAGRGSPEKLQAQSGS